MSDIVINEEIDCSRGVVYVMYTKMFDYYGDCYKIGSTCDISGRMTNYTTSYPDPVEMKYVSQNLKMYKNIETIVHYKLDEYRMNKRREFFKCDLEVIKSTIEEVINYDSDNILQYFDDTKTTKMNKLELDRLNENIKSQVIEEMIVGKSMEEIKNIILAKIEDELYVLKIKHCFNIIKMAGFVVFNEDKVKPNFNKILIYCKNNENGIRSLFKCKKINWDEKIDCKKNTIKQSLVQYINSKLDG